MTTMDTGRLSARRAGIDFVERRLLSDAEFEALVDRIAAREVDPYSAAENLLQRSLKAL